MAVKSRHFKAVETHCDPVKRLVLILIYFLSMQAFSCNLIPLK